MAKDEENDVAFNKLLEDVGHSGRYQKILIGLFLIPCYTVFPLFSMPIFFQTHIPRHWCFVPEVAHSNLSIDAQRKIISPPHDEQCSMYDLNYTEFIHSGKKEVPSNTAFKPCDKGWQFDTTFYDATAVTEWSLVCRHAHYVPLLLSNMFQGGLLGNLLFSLFSDKCGRKSAFLAAAALVAVSDVSSTLVPWFPLLILLRITQGMGLSTLYTSGYFIILELIDPRLRMRINGISTMSWTAGACLVPMLAWLTRSWVYLSTINTCVATCLLLYWFFIPESPSWLISQGKYFEVVEILKSVNRINGGKEMDSTLMLFNVQIIGDAHRREEPKPSFRRCPLTRRRLCLIAVCWACTAVPYFGLNMNTRNLIGNQFVNYFLIISIEIPSHFASWLMLVNAGRRFTVLTMYSLGATILLSAYFLRNHKQVLFIISVLSKACVTSAYASLYVWGPELLPNPLKTRAIRICFWVGTTAACFSSYVVFTAKVSDFIPYSVFGGLMAIALFCSSFLPNTNPKNLPKSLSEAEEFEKDFSPCFCQKWCEKKEEKLQVSVSRNEELLKEKNFIQRTVSI